MDRHMSSNVTDLILRALQTAKGLHPCRSVLAERALKSL